ncbi:hypothetical protein FA13DRAFT_826041 [Coprinellus micaceus]|uniref:Uncharacterized protein n=1 Tax=Coprinellus micaceus TaxID=71717 RepID=A0A4Y7T1Z8_COPMI|nr:hypothetical protein FA13DRAFT_826041 [Coprinellus micaceus]
MVLVGWPMINAYSTTHRSSQQLRDGVYISMPAGFAFNRYSSLVSGKLVKLAGMNPRKATVGEMDRRDPRFVHTAFFTEKGYPVLTWRVALSLLATPEEEAQAKQSEESLRALAKAWSCNHCHDFLEASEAESQTFILEHLRSRHGIAAPKILRDYFLNERCRHTYEVPSEIAIPDRNMELFKCKCTRCHQAVVEKRRFTAEGIQEHFAWVYNRDPVLGVDFVVSRTAMLME